MKPSKFYEKYWLVDGKKPTPLTQKEKDSLDEVFTTPVNVFHMRIVRKASGETIDIDIEKMWEEMKKLPSFLKK